MVGDVRLLPKHSADSEARETDEELARLGKTETNQPETSRLLTAYGVRFSPSYMAY